MGYEVWADVMRLHGGIDWARELEGALRQRAIKMLLVCTPGGLEKQGVRNEIEIAVNLARQLGDNAFIIPLRIEAYDAPFRIAQAQYIDFKRSWAAGLAELTELLRDKAVSRGAPGAMTTWLETPVEGTDKLLTRSEPRHARIAHRQHAVEPLAGALKRHHHHVSRQSRRGRTESRCDMVLVPGVKACTTRYGAGKAMA